MPRIVLFGKMPPIQGGVSARTVELVGALRVVGHELTVITNSRSVAATYRASFLDVDHEILRRRCGNAKMEILEKESSWHIPQSEDFETRMIAKAAAHCEHADLIIGFYLQPYGVAAAISAQLAGKRCVLLHAGSDIGRLALNPEYKDAYRLIFRDVAAISTGLSSRTLLEEVVDEKSVIALRSGYQLPSYFNKPKARFDTTVAEFAKRAGMALAEWRSSLLDETELIRSRCQTMPTRSEFVLGVYGKAGEQKGHLDLVAAVSRLRTQGSPVRLLILTGGSPRSLRRLVAAVMNDEALLNAVTIWPFVPPWLVPDFIDVCDAIAFCERDFEIAIHGPQVPKEVLWRGTPLICSHEIVSKQGFKDAMIPWVNYIPAHDPRDTDALTDVLSRVINTPNLREIGIAGRGLVRAFFGGPRPLDNIVATLTAEGLLEEPRGL